MVDTKHRKWMGWIANGQGDHGFTLMELMVVVAIIVLLAGIILPNYVKRVEKAKMVRAEMDIANLETAIAMYANDMGGYFGNLTGDISPVNTGLVYGPGDTSQNRWRGPYIKGISKDPWGNDYRFYSKGNTPPHPPEVVPPTNLNYYIFSCGKDKNPGTSDDINNWDVSKYWEKYY